MTYKMLNTARRCALITLAAGLLPLLPASGQELVLDKPFMTELAKRPSYWPKMVTLSQAVKYTSGSGTAGELIAGSEVEVIAISEDGVIILAGGKEVTVPAAQTNLAALLPAMKAKVDAQAAAAAQAPAVEAKPTAVAMTEFQTKAGKNLVTLKSKRLSPLPEDATKGKDYIAVYYSASWCGPCRKFTPKLVKFYNEQKRKGHENFEIVFISSDQTEDEMIGYIKEDDMPFPALAFGKKKNDILGKFSGNGIPCLVLLDKDGNILKDSYVDGKYQGPTPVMDELEKLLEKPAG